MEVGGGKGEGGEKRAVRHYKLKTGWGGVGDRKLKGNSRMAWT